MDHNAHQTLYVLGRMQYAPTHTDQKLDGLLADDSPARYILGRMLLRPTHTGKKMDSILSIESKTRYARVRI